MCCCIVDSTTCESQVEEIMRAHPTSRLLGINPVWVPLEEKQDNKNVRNHTTMRPNLGSQPCFEWQARLFRGGTVQAYSKQIFLPIHTSRKGL